MAGAQQTIAWTADLETRDERVDGQHRKIFELLNDLIMACVDGSDAKRLRETLDFLVNYAVRHFTDEEILQMEYDFPEYEKHKGMHERFTEQVVDLVKRYEASGLRQDSDRVGDFGNDGYFICRWRYRQRLSRSTGLQKR